MAETLEGSEPSETGGCLGWRTPLLVLALHAASVAFATYPRVWDARWSLPGSRVDPLQHLWVMRWYKQCLTYWRSPALCPDLQYPVGAPLGNFSPLQFQGALYVVLSNLFKNDALNYNLIWAFGFLLTGWGTFVLAWWVLRDRRCAAFAGVLAMLSGPMMLRAHGHVELQFVGSFPLFLVAWLRFVDRPNTVRLLVAAAAYGFVAVCTAYFAVFAVFPAVLYVAWVAAGCVKRRDWRSLRSRAVWVAVFTAVVAPTLALAFYNQVWAMRHGYAQARPSGGFESLGAPLWGYFVPTQNHLLSALLPCDPYAATARGPWVPEVASYLGLVTIGLANYALVRGVRFRRSGYWWSCLAMMVVLSCGAYWQLGTYRLPLPAGLIKRYLYLFAMIRTTSRFNLLAAVVAALIASAGLKQLLAGLRTRTSQAVVYAGLLAFAVADLSMVPFSPFPIPAIPPCYAVIVRRDPRAAIMDAPLASSGAPHDLNAACGYWQSIHRARTTAGYSGVPNHDFDDLMIADSPLAATKLADPDYMKNAAGDSFSITSGVDVSDYTWLYLTAHQIDYLVLHTWIPGLHGLQIFTERMRVYLNTAKVYEDPLATVYERRLLKPPARPVFLCAEGWRSPTVHRSRHCRSLAGIGRIQVYNPDSGREFTLALTAEAFRTARRVTLKSSGIVLASWDIGLGEPVSVSSPPFRLPADLNELTLESDGDDRPRARYEEASEGDSRPYSLRVYRLDLNGPDGTSGRKPSQ